MSKTRFVLFNSVAWILLVAAIVSVMIEVVWMIVDSMDAIPVRRLLFNFVIGLVIGITVVLANLFSMAFKSRPLLGYVLSLFGVAAILAGVYAYTGLTIGNWCLDAKWLVIFIVSETFTLLAVFFWKRNIANYNVKLALKKASLNPIDED